MARKQFNPQAAAQKWATNFARSGEAYKAGVMGVTVAPGQAAANNAQKWADRVQEAFTSGRYARQVGKVSNSDWQQAAINGTKNFSNGSTKGLPKMNKYLAAAAPTFNDISQTAANMVNDGSSDSQAAIVKMSIDKMKALRDQLK